jgi:hypothetical protein
VVNWPWRYTCIVFCLPLLIIFHTLTDNGISSFSVILLIGNFFYNVVRWDYIVPILKDNKTPLTALCTAAVLPQASRGTALYVANVTCLHGPRICFWGAFAKLRKVLVALSCLSVRIKQHVSTHVFLYYAYGPLMGTVWSFQGTLVLWMGRLPNSIKHFFRTVAEDSDFRNLAEP